MIMFEDINKHLMWQLDRLSSIEDEDVDKVINGEAKRADAIVKVVKQAGELSKIEIQKKKMDLEYGRED